MHANLEFFFTLGRRSFRVELDPSPRCPCGFQNRGFLDGYAIRGQVAGIQLAYSWPTDSRLEAFFWMWLRKVRSAFALNCRRQSAPESW